MDWQLWLFVFSLVLAVYAWTPRRRSVAGHRAVSVAARKAGRVSPARSPRGHPTVAPRLPIVTRLGRAAGRIYVAWLEGWREPLRATGRAHNGAQPLPPLLVQDIAESVDLALFAEERAAVASMPYVAPADELLENMVMGELGTSDTTRSTTAEPRDAVIAKALDKGLSANDLAVLMGGNRAAALAKVRAVREKTAA